MPSWARIDFSLDYVEISYNSVSLSLLLVLLLQDLSRVLH